MYNKVTYKYHCRPGYGSEHLLIEFISGVENKTFIIELLDAIKEINPKFTALEDLWMNDEIIYTVNSDLGEFMLSKDIWDLAFIMSDKNQSCIVQIDKLLLKDKRFQKIEVNFNKFKLNENNKGSL